MKDAFLQEDRPIKSLTRLSSAICAPQSGHCERAKNAACFGYKKIMKIIMRWKELMQKNLAHFAETTINAQTTHFWHGRITSAHEDIDAVKNGEEI